MSEGAGTIVVADTDVEVMITIPYHEYSRLTSIAFNFKKLIDNNARLIEEHFKARINYLEARINQRQR